jgi:hypothetical protein
MADHAIYRAYAKRFVQVHERSLTDPQHYSRIAAAYADQLAAAKQAGMSALSRFWNDVREYSIRMIGSPGVPIPVQQTGNYWVTTGSEEEDRDLRGIVSVDMMKPVQLVRTGEYSPWL